MSHNIVQTHPYCGVLGVVDHVHVDDMHRGLVHRLSLGEVLHGLVIHLNVGLPSAVFEVFELLPSPPLSVLCQTPLYTPGISQDPTDEIKVKHVNLHVCRE